MTGRGNLQCLIRSTVSIALQLVTDTDEQTQTQCRRIYRASIASRGKKQVCADFRFSDHGMTLPARCCALPQARRLHVAVCLSTDGTDGRSGGRTDGHRTVT